MRTDPPPPRGVVLPKKHGDAAPGPTPQSRGSRWTVLGAEIAALSCDHLAVPALAEVSHLLFAAPPGEGSLPPAGSEPLLQVVFTTDGRESGTVRLYRDGTRTSQRSSEDPERVTAVLDASALSSLEERLRALGPGLRCP